MTVQAVCKRRFCFNHCEAAQYYCSECLALWPSLAIPIDSPLSKD